MKKFRKILSFLLVFVMLFSLPVSSIDASAASKASKKIELNKTSETIYVGQTLALKVKNTSKKVVWSSSNKKVATVSSSGKVTAVKAGNTTITAKVGSKKYKCKIEVKNVGLDQKKVKLEVGTSTKLVLNGGKIASAKSSNTKVVTVTKKGKLTAKKTGTATITVTGKDKKKYTCKVTVVLPSYTVTFDTNGGSEISDAKVTKGKTVKEPTAPTKESCIFDGWYKDAEFTTPFDFAKEKITANITIYAKWIDYSINLKSSEKEVYTGSSSYIYFHAEAKQDLESIVLYDSEGNEITELKDDGLYGSSGDDLVGDGIYSGKYLVEYGTESGTLSFYAEGKFTETISTKSNTVAVVLVAPFTYEQLTNLQQADTAIQEQIFTSNFESLTIEEKKTQAETAFTYLVENNLVQDDSIYYDENSTSYSFVYEDGVLGAVLLDESSVEGYESNGSYSLVPEREANASSFLDVLEDSDYATKEEKFQLGKALVLWSFEQAWDDSSFRRPFYQTLETDLEALGLDTLVDYNTTIEDYKNFANYDVIMISGHGAHTTYKEGIFGLNKTTVSSFILTQAVSFSNDKTYTADLKAFRVGKISVKGGKKYAILPNFFTFYYEKDDLEGKVMFSENCEAMGKDGTVDTGMADAILATGVETYIGFHNSVMASYCRNLMKEYVEALLAGQTTGEAFATAKAKYGDNDYFTGREKYGPTAYPILSGKTDFKLVSVSDFTNGDFEIGNTATGWKKVGDARVIKKLGELVPSSNEKMAIITTGIGSSEKLYTSGQDGSYVYQYIHVPENVTKICFSYDVVSEEPLEWVGTKYDDTFVATISNATATLELAKETINDAEWFSIENIDFDGGDHTTYHTKWKDVEIDVSAFAGTDATIKFMVYDVGDSNYDTAALIDNVYFK